jgi:hypothetical protein
MLTSNTSSRQHGSLQLRAPLAHARAPGVGADVPPYLGGLAHHIAVIAAKNWPRPRDGTPSSNFLAFLNTMPIVREPIWNPGIDRGDISRLGHICSSRVNIEAARMQISGSLAGFPCVSCSKGKGTFDRCVVVIYGHPEFHNCASCHVDSLGDQCRWHIQPTPR